jgi:phosphoglycolate phosphatase
MVEQAMADAGAEPKRTVVVGDTSYDMAMAVAAGATAIGVGWGYHHPSELDAAGAYAVAEDPAEVAMLAKEAVNG